jgi:hypothetical protein
VARKQLVPPPFPAVCGRAWDAFGELDRWRPAGAFNLSPITLHDLEAYERRFGDALGAADCAWIKMIDFERLAAAAPASSS